MSISIIENVELIEIMVNYIEKNRPPLEIRNQIDIDYKQENQSIILFEIRPKWNNPKEFIEVEYAKATYIKERNNWKVYWKRANQKWENYKPVPIVETLNHFLNIIDEDKLNCFKG